MAQQDRQRLFLPFGQGLERSDGVQVTAPAKFKDLRNVFQFRGKAQLRKGYTRTTQLVEEDDVTVLDRVLALTSLRSEQAALGVGYSDTTKEAHVNIMSVIGTNATHVASADPNGQLFTLPPGATLDPPVVIAAGSSPRVFFAHDEPLISSRANTRFYDPNSSPQIRDLVGDLDDDGVEEPIQFRGVSRFLSYLVGWGYGTDAEKDRPDVLRVSLAGDPDIFNPRHFFIAGQRSEPIVTARQAGRILLVFKEGETHEIFGYSPETFGIRPADALFGCVGSRLAVSVADAVFFWSTQGPRMSQGGQSVDLAVPLDIEGPDPATLVAESDPERAFAEYDPENRIVMFVWGRRVYALSIRTPSMPRWSYYELGANAEPLSGAQFFSGIGGGGGGLAPVGWPRLGGATIPTAPPPALPVLGDTTIDLTWENNGGGGANGNEVVQVWVRDVEQALPSSTMPNQWFLHASPVIDLTTTGGPDFTQTFQITGLKPAREWEVSLRYKAAGTFTPGFTVGNPDVWTDPACPGPPECPPAYAVALFTTASAPVLPSRGGNNEGKWERTTSVAESITVPITIPAQHEELVMEVERREATIGDPSVQDIGGTGMGPPDTSNISQGPFAVIEAALAAGSTSFLDSAPVPEQLHTYRIRFLAPGNAADGPFSNQLSCHAGPDPPSGFGVDCSGGGLSVITSWANTATPVASDANFPRFCPPPDGSLNVPNAHFTQTWFANKTQAPTTWLPAAGDPALPFANGGSIGLVGGNSGDEARAAVRHRVECSPGIFDYSRWSGFDSCLLVS